MAILPFVGIFVALFLIVRWHNIVVPLRQLTMAQIEGVRRRLCGMVAEVEAAACDEDQQVLKRARELLDKAACEVEACWPVGSPLDFFFWPRGGELRAWRMIHEAERLIALIMTPELAKERLRAISAQSNGRQAPHIVVQRAPLVRLQVGEEAPPSSQAPSESSDDKVIRARLFWELGRYYDEEDTKFARLSVNHAKASWLIAIGVLLIVALLLAQPLLAGLVTALGEMQWWMLFGAIGATLRRMTAAFKPQERITDYGFYWTALFLSPVFGALASVAAMLLLYAATELGVLAQGLLFDDSKFVARLGIAGLSGLSERLVNRLTEQVEGKLAPKAEEGGAAPQSGESSKGAQNQKSSETVAARSR
ncbi:MAG: hypothetical protein RMJ86_08370 [Anaerolineae bacterium]|nr:hypothetical protein [Anaerolineae bacterium]